MLTSQKHRFQQASSLLLSVFSFNISLDNVKSLLQHLSIQVISHLLPFSVLNNVNLGCVDKVPLSPHQKSIMEIKSIICSTRYSHFIPKIQSNIWGCKFAWNLSHFNYFAFRSTLTNLYLWRWRKSTSLLSIKNQECQLLYLIFN